MENKEKEIQLETTESSSEDNTTFPKVLWGIILIILILIGFEVYNNINYQKIKKSIITNNFSDIEGQIDENNFFRNSALNQLQDSEISLVKQKVQIEELQKQFKELRSDLDRLRNQDKLSKIILTFVDLNTKIELGKPYDATLRKLEVLAASDASLTAKIDRLTAILKTKPKGKKEIDSEFSKLIPEIIATKSEDINEVGFWAKVRQNLAKIVTVRRIDGVVNKSGDHVDFVIFSASKLIEEEKYEEASNLLDSLGGKYSTVLKKINSDLRNASDLQKLNEQIFSYLKELSNV